MEDLQVQLASAVGKIPPQGNPLVSHKFGADPYALVYDGRVYLYTTNDVLEYSEDGSVKDNTYGNINKIGIISSADLVNWTDHGVINAAGPEGAAKWATQSWAPAIAHKVINGQDKFFLYFANNASGIGVLEGDSPTGPWKDPIGKALILRSTPGVERLPGYSIQLCSWTMTVRLISTSAAGCRKARMKDRIQHGSCSLGMI